MLGLMDVRFQKKQLGLRKRGISTAGPIRKACHTRLNIYVMYNSKIGAIAVWWGLRLVGIMGAHSRERMSLGIWSLVSSFFWVWNWLTR